MRTIVSSPRSSGRLEEEIIPAHLRDLGRSGRIAREDGEPGREYIVPGRAVRGLNQDPLGGHGQSNLVFEPEGLGPFRRKLNPATWFDRSGPRRTHDCGRADGGVKDVVFVRAADVGIGASMGSRQTCRKIVVGPKPILHSTGSGIERLKRPPRRSRTVQVIQSIEPEGPTPRSAARGRVGHAVATRPRA
jgi:hypothetical protein